MKIYAPWTPEQVANLNEWQEAGYVHPFTCGNDDLHDYDSFMANKVLKATEQGWVCPNPNCGYTQDWAHDFMAEGQRLEEFRPKFIGSEQ